MLARTVSPHLRRLALPISYREVLALRFKRELPAVETNGRLAISRYKATTRLDRTAPEIICPIAGTEPAHQHPTHCAQGYTARKTISNGPNGI